LLGRALANLVDNAVDVLAERGQGEVWLEAEQRGSAIVLRVRDDGPGLARELAFAGTTTKPDGSGLGLLVARAVVVAHGGTLELVDAGGGTTFELTLPA
jgi:signal transduction histidine kinase